MTPHNKFQLRPAQGREFLDLRALDRPVQTSESEPPPVERKPIRYNGSPALLAYPPTRDPHAVLHTPSGATWLTEEDTADLQTEEWEPSRREQALLHYSEEGAYDELAEQEGHGSPFSFILSQIESARSTRGGTHQNTWAQRDAGVMAR